MLLPLVIATVGITPCVLANGSPGLTSGLLLLVVNPTGVEAMRLCEKLKPASLSRLGRMVLTAWTTTTRPGELVLVIAPPGIVEPVNRPPGSVVGIWSISNLPQMTNRSLKE